MHKLLAHNAGYVFLLIASLLAGCASAPDATRLAARHQLPVSLVQAGDFHLAVFGRPVAPAGELRVYLPGDGVPWQGRHPARDPTGRRHIALELLGKDPAPAVLLGRPCYLQRTLDAACEPGLWTSGRYSETVVAALDTALQELMRLSNARSLTLIGYSGGGTLATLLGSRQTLPTTVITLAANLDTEAWTRHHRHLPLTQSLNPARDLPVPAGFRQIHLQGGQDSVVPPATLARYRQQHPQARWWLEPGYDHRCCWVDAWPELLHRALGTPAGDPTLHHLPTAVRATAPAAP